MSAYVTTNRRGRMIAPQYMQPRKPVLDEPLDLESSQRSVVMPAQTAGQAQPAQPQAVMQTAQTQVEAPVVLGDAPEGSTVYYAELAGQQDVAEQPAQFVAEAAETPEAPAVESAPAKRKRRKLSVFQQLIVILLEIVVVMILATVYLYITGRIDLPPVVIDVIEKGLSVIPFIR